MCQYNNHRLSPNNKNIIAYKVLRKTLFGYKSIVSGFKYKIGKTYKDTHEVTYWDKNSICENYFHTFANLEDAVWFCKIKNRQMHNKYIVAKFEIPNTEENTIFYGSINESWQRGFAAKIVKFISCVN